MTPEDRFRQEVYFVLCKIKKNSFYSRNGQDVEYRVYSPPDFSSEGMPYPVEEMRIIDKLVEWRAIKIKDPTDRLTTVEVGISSAMHKFIAVIYLEILQPNFDEIFKKHNECKSKILMATNGKSNQGTEEKMGITNNIGFYKGIYTDFNEGRIWIGRKKVKSKMPSSKMRKMWRLFLSNIGIVITYKKIAEELDLRKQMESNPKGCIENLAQTKKNLVDRIAKLGLKRSTVSKWFIDNNGYGLKAKK